LIAIAKPHARCDALGWLQGLACVGCEMFCRKSLAVSLLIAA
jgi:hypothetical protein